MRPPERKDEKTRGTRYTSVPRGIHSDLSLQNPGETAPCHDFVEKHHTKYSMFMYFEFHWEEEATFYF